MPMINKKLYYKRIIFIALFVLNFSCNNSNKKIKGLHKLEIFPIQISGGWGYNILLDDKIYIHQEFIPSIEGIKAFASKEDALKTANVVVQKLVKGEVPAITKKDLDSLHINL